MDDSEGIEKGRDLLHPLLFPVGRGRLRTPGPFQVLGGEVRDPDILPGVLKLAADIAGALDGQGPLASLQRSPDPAAADAEVEPEEVAVLLNQWLF